MAQITTTLPFVDMPVAADGETAFITKANALPPQFQALTDDSTDFATEANALRDEVNGFQLSASASAVAAANSASSASDSKDYIDQVIGTLQTDIVINDTTPSYTEVFSSQTTLDNINALIDDGSSVTDKTLSSSEIDARISESSSAYSATTLDDIIAGNLISLSSNGEFEKTKNEPALVIDTDDVSNTAIAVSYQSVDKISDDIYAILYSNGTNTYLVSCDVSSGSQVYGAQVDTLLGSGIGAEVCVLSSSRVLITNNSTYKLYSFELGVFSDLDSLTVPRSVSGTASSRSILKVSETLALHVYGNSSSSTNLWYGLISIAGDSLSEVNSASLLADPCLHQSLSFVNNNDYVVTYSNSSAAKYALLRVVSGTSVSRISQGTIESSSIDYTSVSFDSNGSGICALSNGSLYAAYKSGSSVAFTSSGTFSAGESTRSISNKDVGRFVIAYRNGSQNMAYTDLESDGVSVLTGTTLVIDSSNQNTRPSIIADSNKSFMCWSNGSTDRVRSSIIQNSQDNTNRWIGFAFNDALSGNSCSLITIGSVSVGQTGLIIGSMYYLDVATALLTTTDTGIEVGKAVASDKILVTGAGN